MPLPNVLDANGDPMVVGGGVGNGGIKAPGKDSGKGNSGSSAYSPVGRSGNPINAISSNGPTVINERSYSAHAIDRMQGRGIPPSAVENTIKTGTIYPTKSGTTGYYDPANNVRVITNSTTGNVVTVLPGAPTSK